MAHAADCDWHCDQYDFECTCGETRPKAAWFDEHQNKARLARVQSCLEANGFIADNLRPTLPAALDAERETQREGKS